MPICHPPFHVTSASNPYNPSMLIQVITCVMSFIPSVHRHRQIHTDTQTHRQIHTDDIHPQMYKHACAYQHGQAAQRKRGCRARVQQTLSIRRKLPLSAVLKQASCPCAQCAQQEETRRSENNTPGQILRDTPNPSRAQPPGRAGGRCSRLRRRAVGPRCAAPGAPPAAQALARRNAGQRQQRRRSRRRPRRQVHWGRSGVDGTGRRGSPPKEKTVLFGANWSQA